jgi:hypothetical protein
MKHFKTPARQTDQEEPRFCEQERQRHRVFWLGDEAGGKAVVRRYLALVFLLCLVDACGSELSPTADLVATQIAVEKAAHATMTAEVSTVTIASTVTDIPRPTDTATIPPKPTSSYDHAQPHTNSDSNSDGRAYGNGDPGDRSG